MILSQGFVTKYLKKNINVTLYKLLRCQNHSNINNKMIEITLTGILILYHFLLPSYRGFNAELTSRPP